MIPLGSGCQHSKTPVEGVEGTFPEGVHISMANQLQSKGHVTGQQIRTGESIRKKNQGFPSLWRSCFKCKTILEQS